MSIKVATDYPTEYTEFVEFYEKNADTPLTETQLASITLNEDKSNEKEVKENQIKLLEDIGIDVQKDVSYADKALKVIENLGLILFVTSVGFIAGPKFFGNFKKNFKSYVVLALVVILAGGLAAVGCIYFGRFVMGETNHEEFTAMIVGLLSGSLTSTPAFSAAKASTSYEDAVSVGHGIAYIFGVIGVVLFVQIIPKLTRANMDVERAKLNTLSATNVKEEKKEKKKFKLLDLDGHGFAAFALAAIIGTFIGMIKIPLTAKGLSGTCFSLTTTGGCLLISLLFGHFAHIGPVNVTPKDSTLKIFKELGLILFLVGAGIAGGAKFIELFKFSYFVYGIVMTVIPMIIGYIFAKYVLKLSLLNNLGSLTGAMTSTPALGTLIGVSKTDDVAAAYAATYPIALIAVVLVSQFLVILF
ncbi:MAG: permease [Ruminococcaceae bacterium]|nr:permease [Oscillospiraceae bacterium]